MAEDDIHDNVDAAIELVDEDSSDVASVVPEDVVRAKAKWEIEESQRRLAMEEEKLRKQLELPVTSLTGLPEDIIRLKVQSDIDISTRKMKLEELRADHAMMLENKIEDFRQMEILKINAIITSTEEQHWLRKYWRPAAGWVYLIICMFDFVIAPVLFAVLPVFTKLEHTPWTSITTANGGLMHISFGAILGVAAWTRGQGELAKTKLAASKIVEES